MRTILVSSFSEFDDVRVYECGRDILDEEPACKAETYSVNASREHLPPSYSATFYPSPTPFETLQKTCPWDEGLEHGSQGV